MSIKSKIRIVENYPIDGIMFGWIVIFCLYWNIWDGYWMRINGVVMCWL